MTQLIHRKGDIFTSTARAIGHGVNTQGVMGAGIAVGFRSRFEQMYRDYKTICEHGEFVGGDVFTYAFTTGGESQPYFIYNIASQEQMGSNANIEFLIDGVILALQHAESESIPFIALPRIGSGIGGLNEREVEGALNALARISTVDIELWTYES